MVNVPADRDGLVRHYYFSSDVNGEDMASVASYLSAVFGLRGEIYPVNYALTPDSVPAYSAVDILRGDVPAETFQGKSIVIGAHALELRDNFAVPVHGIVPGAAHSRFGRRNTASGGSCPGRRPVSLRSCCSSA